MLDSMRWKENRHRKTQNMDETENARPIRPYLAKRN